MSIGDLSIDFSPEEWNALVALKPGDPPLVIGGGVTAESSARIDAAIEQSVLDIVLSRDLTTEAFKAETEAAEQATPELADSFRRIRVAVPVLLGRGVLYLNDDGFLRVQEKASAE